MAKISEMLFPRAMELQRQGVAVPDLRYIPAATFDALSLPGRAYASLGAQGGERFGQALARTAPATGGARRGGTIGETDEIAEMILRDPTLPLSGLGGLLARSVGSRAVAEGLAGAATTAADQWATTGRVDALGPLLSATMGAAPHAMGGRTNGTMRAIDPKDYNLNVNPDGTVSLYHHTDPASAAKIAKESILRSKGEPSVYFTTESRPVTGYGESVVRTNVDPRKIDLDDEFPDGRFDFRADLSRPGGSFPLKSAEVIGGSAKPRTMISPEERAANFRNWFGDSKVVDEAGNPLVVYHGTNANFSQYNPVQHFGTKKAAQDRLDMVGGNSPSIMPSYISAKNILEIEDNGLMTPLDIAISSKRSGADIDVNSLLKDYVDSFSESDLTGIAGRLGYYNPSEATKDNILGDLVEYARRGQTSDLMSSISRYGDPREGDFFGNFEAASKNLQNQLKEYDALEYRNDVEDVGSSSFIVISPNRVKSAIGNRGTFDPTDPNITHFTGGGASAPAQSLGQILADRTGRRMVGGMIQGMTAPQPSQGRGERPTLGSMLVPSKSDTYHTRRGR